MRPGGGSLSVADMRQMRRNRVKRKFTAEVVPVASAVAGGGVAALSAMKPARRQFTAETAPMPSTLSAAGASAAADSGSGAAPKQTALPRPRKQLPAL